MIQIGCVADDFTGASDWASFFAEKGVDVVLYNGVPDDRTEDFGAQVVVIALKTRTAPVDAAVKESLQAFQWLKQRNTKQYYLKYCSTFDCTRTGNIGPVADAAMEFLGETYSVLCPGLPVNGRTTKAGCLYVYGVPLHESSMKNHPLTPMWDYRIEELMREQSNAEIVSVLCEQYCDKRKTKQWIELQAKREKPLYFVPDFFEQEQGKDIVELFGERRLLTGGSGLCTYLADMLEKNEFKRMKGVESPAVLIAGSCSTATLGQIAFYLKTGKKAVKMHPDKLLDGSETTDKLWAEISRYDQDILIYSSEDVCTVKENQKKGKERLAAVIEHTQAELAKRLLEAGRRRIIVSGGETAGAITKKLGYHAYHIGGSIAPGVPVMAPVSAQDVRLVLKSGNFGQEDFLIRALDMTKGEEEGYESGRKEAAGNMGSPQSV